MEPESVQNSSTVEDRRQARRRKLIENAKSRMEKVKNTQRSHSLAEQCREDVIIPPPAIPPPVNMGLEGAIDTDPPDEVIPQLPTRTSASFPPPSYSPPVPSGTKPTSSLLNSAVVAFMSDRVWRIRTVLSVICAVSLVCLKDMYSLEGYSNVLVMCLLDCSILCYIVLAYHPSNAATANPLGKLSLLKIPLMVFHSASAKWFDSVCLSTLLVFLILRDVLLMVFVTIIVTITIHMTI